MVFLSNPVHVVTGSEIGELKECADVKKIILGVQHRLGRAIKHLLTLSIYC